VLTYVPQDIDGFLCVHMWIGAGQHSMDRSTSPSIFSVCGFPGSVYSLFPNAYSVVFFVRNLLLPPNQALATDHAGHCGTQWLGDVLVVKHTGHDFRTYQSMTYDDKALVDAILLWYVFFFHG
jgi:hypothetical protein